MVEWWTKLNAAKTFSYGCNLLYHQIQSTAYLAAYTFAHCAGEMQFAPPHPAADWAV